MVGVCNYVASFITDFTFWEKFAFFIALSISVITLVLLVRKCVCDFLKAKREKAQIIPNLINEISKRQEQTDRRLEETIERRKELEQKREDIAAEVAEKLRLQQDLYLRLTLDMDKKINTIGEDMRLVVSSVGASLDGLIQHDPKINGPVKRWKERLEDRIAEGVGGQRSPRTDKNEQDIG